MRKFSGGWRVVVVVVGAKGRVWRGGCLKIEPISATMGKELPFKTPTKQFAAHNQESGNILSHFPLQYKHGHFRHIAEAQMSIGAPTMTHDAGRCTSLIVSHFVLWWFPGPWLLSGPWNHFPPKACGEKKKQFTIFFSSNSLSHFKYQNINLPGAPGPSLSSHFCKDVWRSSDFWVAPLVAGHTKFNELWSPRPPLFVNRQ